MNVRSMSEPFLSQFREMIREGAGTLDFHDGQAGTTYTREVRAYDSLIEREVARVDLHLASICKLLERYVGRVGRVLDVGCGTGATTIAVALASGLGGPSVLGIDPNARSIAAARVRAQGYGLDDRVRFEHVEAGKPFPVEPDSHDLVLCISVLEYLGSPESRRQFGAELLRAARPGGTICLATPSPYRLRDYHTRRLFGDFRRREGYPWASRPAEIREMFRGHAVRFLRGEQFEHGLMRRGIRIGKAARLLAPFAAFLQWQKVLVTKSPAR